MLSVAYNKLSKFNNVSLLKQNMVNFHIGKKFDSIISICDSINYIINKEDLLNTFKKAREHLNDDGILIFDINSYSKLKNIIGENTFIEDTEDVFYTWENYFDEENSICKFFLTFFVKNKNGSYRRFDEEHIERAYHIEEIVDLLKKAKFSHIYYYDAFTFDEPKKESERINFVVFP